MTTRAAHRHTYCDMSLRKRALSRCECFPPLILSPLLSVPPFILLGIYGVSRLQIEQLGADIQGEYN